MRSLVLNRGVWEGLSKKVPFEPRFDDRVEDRVWRSQWGQRGQVEAIASDGLNQTEVGIEVVGF